MLSEKKVVRRSVAVGLGIVCILLIALIAYFSITGISAQNSYNNLQNQNKQLQTWLDDNITYYTSQIANLTNQLNSLMNGTEASLGTIMNDPSVWVNRTVVVEGTEIAYLALSPLENSPYDMLLGFGDNTIGLVLTPSVGGQISEYTSPFLIYGVVRQGQITWPRIFNITTGAPAILSENTYYIEAETIKSI